MREDADCVRCIGGKDFVWDGVSSWPIQTSMPNNCQSTGMAIGGRCVPKSDDDCWHQCFEFGRCHEREGTCVAESDADCAASLTCVSYGNCTADVVSGNCFARGYKDCTKGAWCKKADCDWCPKSFDDDLPRCSWGSATLCKVAVVEVPAP